MISDNRVLLPLSLSLSPSLSLSLSLSLSPHNSQILSQTKIQFRLRRRLCTYELTCLRHVTYRDPNVESEGQIPEMLADIDLSPHSAEAIRQPIFQTVEEGVGCAEGRKEKGITFPERVSPHRIWESWNVVTAPQQYGPHCRLAFIAIPEHSPTNTYCVMGDHATFLMACLYYCWFRLLVRVCET